MTLLAALLVLGGVGLVGVGQRRAATDWWAPQVLGIGVVLFFGGVALASFRSGDRAPVVILGTVGVLVLGFMAAALRRRRPPA